MSEQWNSRKMKCRAVVVEALVHVGAVLQMLPEQVDLAVARRRVKGHGAPLHCLSTRLVTDRTRMGGAPRNPSGKRAEPVNMNAGAVFRQGDNMTHSTCKN